MSVDPFALPGMITTSKTITADDVSSDDEDDNFAHIKSGPAKKAALREKERIRNLRAQSEGSKPSDETPPSAGNASEPHSANKRHRTAPSKRSTCSAAAGLSADTVDLSQEDANLQEQKAGVALQEQQARDRSRKRMQYALDDNDDEPSPPPGRDATGSRQGSASTAAARSARVWFKVMCDGTERIVSCGTDESLETFRKRAATAHGLSEGRAQLRFCDETLCGEPTPGVPIDLKRTPRELGLASGKPRIWVEEAAEQTIVLKLRRSGSAAPVELSVVPTASFRTIKEQYAQQHGAGLTLYQLRLDFDGDELADDETPASQEIEDSDLIDVIVT